MKYILAVMALLIAVLGGVSYIEWNTARLYQSKAKAATAERDGALAALAAERKNRLRVAKISDARQVKINQLAMTGAATQRKLDEALKANREWAAARVPDGVWNALGYPADAGQAGPGMDAASPGAAAARPR